MKEEEEIQKVIVNSEAEARTKFFFLMHILYLCRWQILSCHASKYLNLKHFDGQIFKNPIEYKMYIEIK